MKDTRDLYRRVRVYSLSRRSLVEELQRRWDGGPWISCLKFGEIPDGATILDVAYEIGSGTFEIVVAHESFDTVKSGRRPPSFMPGLTYQAVPTAHGWTKLLEAIDTDAQGCFTGDCPHDSANECVRSIREWLQEVRSAFEMRKVEQPAEGQQ